MNTRSLFAGTVALLALVSLSARSAEPMTQFTARSGSTMRIDGTANMIHTTWRVASPIIGGKLEVGPGFPMEPGQAATAGKLTAKADVFVQTSSLKSVEEDGRPYSDAMDNVMYEHLKADQFKRIEFHLTSLTLKEAAKAKDAPYLFDAKGDLVLAGVTNAISMPVSVLPMGLDSKGDNRLKITGSVSVKMTSFKIEPPAPKVAMGMLKTGDDVKLSFEWMVGHKPTSTAAAK